MKAPPPAVDIPRITLGILWLVGMLAASVWVMLPFFLSLSWAATVVIATWPILLWVQRRLGGRRGPAVAVMVVAMLAMLVIPTWLGISAISDNAPRVEKLVHSLATEGLPPPPGWLESVPLVGGRLVEKWQGFSGHPDELMGQLQPYAQEAVRWVAAKAKGLVQLLLMVVISGILFASGEKAANGVLRFLRRLAGERGENVGLLAAKAVRAVALGVVVTALAQTLVAGLGLFLGGVPHAGVLTAIIFVLSIAQLGPLLVVLPATIWVYSSGAVGRGTLLLVFSVLALVLDNVLRPVLIKKGADLSLLLILTGVVGGVLAFGVVGLFIGPVLLAVAWTLVAAWVGDIDRHPEALDAIEKR
jgi:predicted PurR-regulated permease PerM